MNAFINIEYCYIWLGIVDHCSRKLRKFFVVVDALTARKFIEKWNKQVERLKNLIAVSGIAVGRIDTVVPYYGSL